MFKLVVLSVMVAVSMAAPGLLHAPVAYAVPTAVSHQSRVDVHHAPVLAGIYSVAPATVPVLGHGLGGYLHAVPAAVSHSARVDVHRSGVIATPVGYGYGVGYAGPVVHGW